MPSKMTTLALLFLAVVLGYGLGLSNADIKVEKVEVIKSLPIKVTKTVETRIPLPEACMEVAEKADALSVNDSRQTKAVGDIKLALQDLGTESFLGDVREVNRLIEVINEQKGIIDDSVIAKDEARLAYENEIETCQQQLNR